MEQKTEVDYEQVKQGTELAKTKAKITFVQNPLKTFGIIFNHAYPLDLSVTKFCYQGCPFCFANVNRMAKGDIIGKTEDPTDQFFKKAMKALGQGFNRESLQEWCIRKKYPVVFSNNVDPFMPASEEQFKIGERVLTFALEHEMPLFIQTKEVYYGQKVKELIIKGKHLFQLYVSISSLDFDTAKKYETVLITPEERLKRIKELTDAGVKVTIALNPYVPEWQPDLHAFFKAVKDSGADGVYTYPLHFSPKQKKSAPKRLGQYVEQSNRYNDFYEDTKIMEKICTELGVKLHYPRRLPDNFYNGNALWSDDQIWPIDPQRIMETVYEVYEENKVPVIITWESIDRFYSQYDEWNNIFKLDEFAGVMWTDNQTYFDVRATLGQKNRMKNIVRYIWNNPDMQDHFMNFYSEVFRLVEFGADGVATKIVGENGDLIYVYDPNYLGDPNYIDEKLLENNSIELEIDTE